MRIDIDRLDTFYEVAYPTYHRLKQESGDAFVALDLAFAPGRYTRTALNLTGDGGGRVRLTLTASDPTNPPVFSDLSIHLSSDAIELNHLIFLDTALEVSLLDLRVGSALVVRRCAFVANGSRANPGGELLSFSATLPGARADIRDCWFVRNRTRHHNPLLALHSTPPGYFAEARLDNVAFLDNAVETVIAPYAAQTLEITNCALSPPAETPAPPTFVAINTTGTALTVSRSLLIGQSLPTLVTRWSSTESSLDAFQPVRVTHSALFVEQDDPLPNSVIEDSAVQPAALLDRSALDQGIDRAVDQAQAGLPPEVGHLYAALTAT